jgi:threonine/homoserine/homoserine lactone efflux protein
MDRMLELATGGASLNSPLAAFVLTSLIIEMTPGPNMAYLAVLGAGRGRLAGFSAVLGVASDWRFWASRSGSAVERSC